MNGFGSIDSCKTDSSALSFRIVNYYRIAVDYAFELAGDQNIRVYLQSDTERKTCAAGIIFGIDYLDGIFCLDIDGLLGYRIKTAGKQKNG